MQHVDPAAFLEAHLPLVESVVADIARRQRLRGDDLEEFRSVAFMKLVEHDYQVVRRFQGTSSFRTYLTVVLQRLLLDHRNREWGRWRPSAAAVRLGPAAVELERLVTRDGLAVHEAVETVGAAGNAKTCVAFLETLKERTPRRGTRSTLGEDAIPDRVDPAPGPDEDAARRELRMQWRALQTAIENALRTLDGQDHLILTLRFRDGLPVPEVARVLGVEAKPLYRRIERILDRLHELLSADPVKAELARDLADGAWCDFVPEGESGWWRPSNRVDVQDSVHDTGRGRESMPRSRAARRVHRSGPLPVPMDGTASV